MLRCTPAKMNVWIENLPHPDLQVTPLPWTGEGPGVREVVGPNTHFFPSVIGAPMAHAMRPGTAYEPPVATGRPSAHLSGQPPSSRCASKPRWRSSDTASSAKRQYAPRQ